MYNSRANLRRYYPSKCVLHNRPNSHKIIITRQRRHPVQPHLRPPPSRPGTVDRVDNQPQRKEVSETDLYLLGAIEKLVYRVDHMEKRLRKMEDTLHHLVLGKDTVEEGCASNFSRVGRLCLQWGESRGAWQGAAGACRKMRARLLELPDDATKRTLIAALRTIPGLGDSEWWVGGLNPGLLWIWAGSGRPVLRNSTSGASAAAGLGGTIPGEGRCLALLPDPARRDLMLHGVDCSRNYRYICEKEEDRDKISNEIEQKAHSLQPLPTATTATTPTTTMAPNTTTSATTANPTNEI